MSAQSRMSVASEHGLNPDVGGTLVGIEDAEEHEPKPAKGKGGKRPSKAKAPSKKKTTHSKDYDTTQDSSMIVPDLSESQVTIENEQPRPKKGRKRDSDEMSVNPKDDTATIQPPTKRRGTRSRASAAQSEMDVEKQPYQDIPIADEDFAPPPRRASTKTYSKKRGSSARKVSAASKASQASLRAAVSVDDDIDAALEADLNRPLTDEEDDGKIGIESQDTVPAKNQSADPQKTRTRTRASTVTASVAPTRKMARASSQDMDAYNSVEHSQSAQEENAPMASVAKQRKGPTTKTRTTRKASKQTKQLQEGATDEDTSNLQSHVQAEEQSQHEEISDVPKAGMRHHDLRKTDSSNATKDDRTSFASVEESIAAGTADLDSSVLTRKSTLDESGHETDASMASQSTVRKSLKKRVGAAKKGKKAPKAKAAPRNIEDIIYPQIKNNVEHVDHDLNDENVEMSGALAPPEAELESKPATKEPVSKKATAKTAKPKREAKTTGKQKQPEPDTAETRLSNADLAIEKPQPEQIEPQPLPSSVAKEVHFSPPVQQPSPVMEPSSSHSLPNLSTPSPSPQASDAENQPPSTRPSAKRPPVLSPSKGQAIRIPLAPTTPTMSPSKRNIIAGSLQSSYSWTAIDLENVFMAAGDQFKENADLRAALLTSPEKKMTVEDWVAFNAKRGEANLRAECERMVGIFEKQGGRAMMALEGIECYE